MKLSFATYEETLLLTPINGTVNVVNPVHPYNEVMSIVVVTSEMYNSSSV